MRIIEPSYEIMDMGQMDPVKKIELVGRVCYKSESLITEDSAPRFVSTLIERQHYAMLEHASIIIESDFWGYVRLSRMISAYEEETGLPAFINITKENYLERFKFSGNVRAWRELLRNLESGERLPIGIRKIIQNHPVLFGDLNFAFSETIWEGCVSEATIDDLKNPKEIARHTPLTVKFTVDIAVARELCRHRLASHAGSSTRYCDYSKGKFGGEIAVVEPQENYRDDGLAFVRGAAYAEAKYLEQRAEGIPPEIARSSLPLGTMCEHVMTMPLEKWKHIFNLRALDKTGKAHPQIKRVMIPLLEEVEKLYPMIDWRA